MAERRYNDKEIAAIFRAAAEEGPQSPQREVARDEGLTLSELQAIGSEVGIPSDAVAQAARAVDVRLGAASRTFLGLPIGVARTVNLNRRLTMKSGSGSSCNCAKSSTRAVARVPRARCGSGRTETCRCCSSQPKLVTACASGPYMAARAPRSVRESPSSASPPSWSFRVRSGVRWAKRFLGSR